MAIKEGLLIEAKRGNEGSEKQGVLYSAITMYYHERAKCRNKIGKYDESIIDFDTVIKRNPSNAHAYFGRGLALKAQKKYSEASADFETSKRLDPDNLKLIINYRTLNANSSTIELCKPGEEPIYK